MQFPLSIHLLALALPASISAVCAPNQLAIGITSLCNIGTIGIPGTCRYIPTMWSDTCVELDSAQNADSDVCVGGWKNGAQVNCVPGTTSEIWNVKWTNGERFGSYPESSVHGCYRPSGTQFCGRFLFGFAQVHWCCPRVSR